MHNDSRGESDCFAPFFFFSFSKVSPLAKKRFTAVPYITPVKLRDNKYRDGEPDLCLYFFALTFTVPCPSVALNTRVLCDHVLSDGSERVQQLGLQTCLHH